MVTVLVFDLWFLSEIDGRWVMGGWAAREMSSIGDLHSTQLKRKRPIYQNARVTMTLGIAALSIIMK